MAPRKTKRAATLVVAVSCFLLCIAGTSAAQSEDSEAVAAGEKGASTEGIGEKRPRLNSIRLSGVYAHQFLNERNSATTAEPLGTRESFGGFEPAYQRELIEKHLAIVDVTFVCRTGPRSERGSEVLDQASHLELT